MICKLCKKQFKRKQIINGKFRNFQNRKYCLECSPFGSRNIRKLEITGTEKLPKKVRDGLKYKKWQQKTRKERKKILVNLLGGKCIVCGYNRCNAALEFHHINEKEKKENGFGISSIGLLSRWELLLKEVKKCVLLCSNCHREIHAGIIKISGV